MKININNVVYATTAHNRTVNASPPANRVLLVRWFDGSSTRRIGGLNEKRHIPLECWRNANWTLFV